MDTIFCTSNLYFLLVPFSVRLTHSIKLDPKILLPSGKFFQGVSKKVPFLVKPLSSSFL